MSETEGTTPAPNSASPVAHTLCGAEHPTEPLTCALVDAGFRTPHWQHVAHRPGDEPLEQRTVTWPRHVVDMDAIELDERGLVHHLASTSGLPTVMVQSIVDTCIEKIEALGFECERSTPRWNGRGEAIGPELLVSRRVRDTATRAARALGVELHTAIDRVVDRWPL